jgi:hypothetical protein
VVAVKRDLAVLRGDLKALVAHKQVHREHLLRKAHAQKVLKALRLDQTDKLQLLRIVTAKAGQRDLRLDLKDQPLKVATAVVSQKDLAVLKVDLKAHKVALA